MRSGIVSESVVDFSRNVVHILLNINTPRWIVILFVWSLCVQVLFNVFVVGLDSNLSGDELRYNSLAVNLVTQHQFIGAGSQRSFSPPFFPLCLTLVYRVFGLENYVAARVGQSLVGALLCVVLFILAQRTFDNRTGLLAGFMASVYPYLVYYSSQLRPELLYWLCVYASVVPFQKFIETRRLVFGIIAGICWGIAALTRSEWLLAVPLLLIWGLLSLGKSRQNFLRIFVVLIATITIIIPWTWRNYLVHNAFVPINTTSGIVTATTNNPLILKNPARRGQWVQPKEMVQFVGDLSELSEIERDRVYVEYALTFIQQNPVDFLKLGLWRLVNHWHFYYPKTCNSVPELVGLLLYFIVLFLAILGTTRLFIRRRRLPGFVYFTFVLFIFTNINAFSIIGATRYRLLIDPSLIILASYAVISPVDASFQKRLSDPNVGNDNRDSNL